MVAGVVLILVVAVFSGSVDISLQHFVVLGLYETTMSMMMAMIYHEDIGDCGSGCIGGDGSNVAVLHAAYRLPLAPLLLCMLACLHAFLRACLLSFASCYFLL